MPDTVDPVGDDDSGSLNRLSPVPVWRQLAAILRRQIDSGEITGKVPGEQTLAQRYGVARDTVRQALKLLGPDGEGLVTSSRGRGWFVVPPGERPKR